MSTSRPSRERQNDDRRHGMSGVKSASVRRHRHRAAVNKILAVMAHRNYANEAPAANESWPCAAAENERDGKYRNKLAGWPAAEKFVGEAVTLPIHSSTASKSRLSRGRNVALLQARRIELSWRGGGAGRSRGIASPRIRLSVGPSRRGEPSGKCGDRAWRWAGSKTTDK